MLYIEIHLFLSLAYSLLVRDLTFLTHLVSAETLTSQHATRACRILAN